MYGLVVVRDCGFIITALRVGITTIVERLDIAGVELEGASVVFHSKGVLPHLKAEISDVQAARKPVCTPCAARSRGCPCGTVRPYTLSAGARHPGRDARQADGQAVNIERFERHDYRLGAHGHRSQHLGAAGFGPVVQQPEAQGDMSARSVSSRRPARVRLNGTLPRTVRAAAVAHALHLCGALQ